MSNEKTHKKKKEKHTKIQEEEGTQYKQNDTKENKRKQNWRKKYTKTTTIAQVGEADKNKRHELINMFGRS